MYIQYDECELIELFMSQPISLSDDFDAGDLMYIHQDESGFKLIMTISTYRQTCGLDFTYNDSLIFTGSFENVKSIQKYDATLVIHIDEEEKVNITFDPHVCVKLL